MTVKATALAAVLLFAPQDAEPAPGLARFITGETDLVVRAPDMPALLAKLKSPPYAGLLKDKTVQEALAKLFGDLGIDPINLLYLVRGEAMLAIPRFDETAVVAVFDTGLPINPYTAILTRLFGPEWKRKEEKIEGITAVKMTGTGTSTLYFASHRRYLVVCSAKEGLTDVLKRIANPKREGSLAESAPFRKCAAAAGKADAVAFIHWRRVRERAGLLALLPSGWGGAAAVFEPAALKISIHFEEEKAGELAGLFGPGDRFRPPPAMFEDADSLLVVRPNWNAWWDRLEGFSADGAIQEAWGRFKRSSGVDLKADLLATFGEDAALIERFAGESPGALGWASLRKPIRARKVIRSVAASMSGEHRFFEQPPREEPLQNERTYRIGGAAVAATSKGLLAGTSGEIRRVLEANGSPEHNLVALGREHLPESAVLVHLQTGEGWRRRLAMADYPERLIPKLAFAPPKAAELFKVWRERLASVTGLYDRLQATAVWANPAPGGLKIEARLVWKPE